MTSIHNKFQLAAFTLCLFMGAIIGAALIGGPLQSLAVQAFDTLSPLFVILAACVSGAYVARLWALWGAEAVKAWRAALWRHDAPTLPYDGELFDPSPDDETQFRIAEAWQRQVLIFAFIANQEGFTLRRMLGHVSRTEWELFVNLLAQVGAVQTGKRGRGARWAQGWNYPRLRAEVKHGLLSLPHPDAEPPVVVWQSRSPTQVARASLTSDTRRTVIYNR